MPTNHRPRGPKTAVQETPLIGRPKRPTGLDTEAANHYDEILGLMEQAGTLSLLDGDSLKVYIDAWMRYRKAKIQCDTSGYVVDSPHGVKKSPWYIIMMEAGRMLRDYADRFGLTPLGRGRLKIEPRDDDGESKWAGFNIRG